MRGGATARDSSDYQESERRASIFAFCRSCEVVRTKGGIHATVPTCRDRATVRSRTAVSCARPASDGSRTGGRGVVVRRVKRGVTRRSRGVRARASRSRGRGSGPTRYIVWYSVVGTTHGTYVGEKLNEKNYMLRRWRDSRVSGRAPVLYNSPSCSRRFCEHAAALARSCAPQSATPPCRSDVEAVESGGGVEPTVSDSRLHADLSLLRRPETRPLQKEGLGVNVFLPAARHPWCRFVGRYSVDCYGPRQVRAEAGELVGRLRRHLVFSLLSVRHKRE